MHERLIRLAGRLYPPPWRRRYGVEFEALCDTLSIIALPDQFVSSTILHVNTMMEEPSIDFTGKLAVGLIQNTLSRDSLAGVIERLG